MTVNSSIYAWRAFCADTTAVALLLFSTTEQKAAKNTNQWGLVFFPLRSKVTHLFSLVPRKVRTLRFFLGSSKGTLIFSLGSSEGI